MIRVDFLKALLLFLGCVSVVGGLGFLISKAPTTNMAEFEKAQAYGDAKFLVTAMVVYKKKLGRAAPIDDPSTLYSELRRISQIEFPQERLSPAKEFLDPWRTPYYFTSTSPATIMVASAGPDGHFGTSDDISAKQ